MSRTIICIINQPTQYDPPLWTALQRRGTLRPIVWYVKMTGFSDPDTGQLLSWGDDRIRTYEFESVDRKVLAARFAALFDLPVAVLSDGWAHDYTRRLAWACLRRGVPMILPSDRVADPSEPWARRQVRKLVRRITSPVFRGHITPGTLGKNALLADGIAANRIETALYPVDVALFQSRLMELRNLSQQIRNRWPADAKVVVAVAKHVARESPMLLIDSFACLRRQVPKARFLFVGDGPMRGAIQARIVELGLEDDVFLPGYVPYPQLPAYYGAADLFLHVAEFEPWGISVSEAMACGLPVVATASVGSTVDLVVPGVTGAVADAADPAVLAVKLLEALELAGSAATRAAVLRQVDRVDVEQAAARIESLVDRITGH